MILQNGLTKDELDELDTKVTIYDFFSLGSFFIYCPFTYDLLVPRKCGGSDYVLLN